MRHRQLQVRGRHSILQPFEFKMPDHCSRSPQLLLSIVYKRFFTKKKAPKNTLSHLNFLFILPSFQYYGCTTDAQLNTKMTDTVYRYSHSKHSRRTKSISKHKERVQLKRKLDAIPISTHRAKSVLEYQRKEWTKMSKHSKPRAQKRATLLSCQDVEEGLMIDDFWVPEDIYDDRYIEWSSHSDCGDNRQKNTFLKYGDDELHFHSTFGGGTWNPYAPSYIRRCTVRSLMSREFGNYDFKYMRFDVSTVMGQCSFWYYIMDRMGILNELYYLQYLSHCTKPTDCDIREGQWYQKRVMERFLGSVHCLYIFGDIKRAADLQFQDDLTNAHCVVIRQEDLVDILYDHNVQDLTVGLCKVIAGFVMTTNRKGSPPDISWRYYQNGIEDTESVCISPMDFEGLSKRKRKRIRQRCRQRANQRSTHYQVRGHWVTDRKRVDIEFTEGIPLNSWDDLIGKVYDGRDITDKFNQIHKLHKHNEPLFGPYHRSKPWKNILIMTFMKFKEYYRHQSDHNLPVCLRLYVSNGFQLSGK